MFEANYDLQPNSTNDEKWYDCTIKLQQNWYALTKKIETQNITKWVALYKSTTWHVENYGFRAGLYIYVNKMFTKK